MRDFSSLSVSIGVASDLRQAIGAADLVSDLPLSSLNERNNEVRRGNPVDDDLLNNCRMSGQITIHDALSQY